MFQVGLVTFERMLQEDESHLRRGDGAHCYNVIYDIPFPVKDESSSVESSEVKCIV